MMPMALMILLIPMLQLGSDDTAPSTYADFNHAAKCGDAADAVDAANAANPVVAANFGGA